MTSRSPDLAAATRWLESLINLERLPDLRGARLDLGPIRRLLARLGAPEGGKSPIAGNFSLALDEFPIEIVPALENRQIRGKVSGDVRLDDRWRAVLQGPDMSLFESIAGEMSRHYGYDV